jgi:ceroid-lipofuscinosis MFS transporter 7
MQMWLFVLSLGGSKASQGFSIASFNAGRFLFSPIFGFLSETHGHRRVLIACNIIIALGCLSYVYSSNLYWLSFGQFLMGVGAGSLGVTRSYVAENSVKESRTVSLANLTAVQYLGFFVSPIIGAFLAAIGHHNRFTIPIISLKISEYTLPALFIGILTSLNAVILYKYVSFSAIISARDASISEKPESKSFTMLNETTANDSSIEMGTARSEGPLVLENRWYSSFLNFTAAGKVAIAGCILNVVLKGSIGIFETLGSTFVMTHINWDGLQTGYTYASFGFCGIFLLISFSLFQNSCRVKDLDLIKIGMIFMALSCFLLAMVFTSAPTTQFYFALTLMYVVGYPLGHTALLGAVSNVITGPQGTLMGWFSAFGSLARILSPLLAGYLDEGLSTDLIFVFVGCLLVLMIGLLTQFRKLVEDVIEF